MQIADDFNPIAQAGLDQLTRYREMLLAAGFREPTKLSSHSGHWRFFKQLTSLTAFIVNLKAHDAQVDVTYGCASTAYTLMANDADALTSLGEDDNTITLRARLTIRTLADEAHAAQAIRQMYDQFATVEKDELLALAKEKRKAFIQQFAVRLKPLGFRKKGNKWLKALPGGFTLTFHLDKSSYADMYYFDVMLRADSMTGFGSCYDSRVPVGECSDRWRMDWQLFPADALADFLDGRLIPRLMRLMDTPFAQLGADPALWACCDCQRTHCSPCWVQHNLWETQAVQTET